jgi:Flp pilus assembly protein CpaB
MSARPPGPRASRRRAGLPFIIGGAALGVLAFGAVLFYTTSAAGSTAGNVPVVVAAHDLQIRVPVLPGDLIVVQFHSSDVPPGAFSKITDINGVVAAINISKGQPVTSNLLVTSTDVVIGPQSAFLPIPAGFVALTIPTGEQQGVAGYIQVGDYISLEAVIAGKTSTNIRTIYTNIPVIRVGPAPSESAPVQGSSANPPKTGGPSTSLTVVVTQCQAEFLNWFLSNGNLKYTLESFHDYKPQDVAADPACPDVNSAKGVTVTDISARWPGILN